MRSWPINPRTPVSSGFGRRGGAMHNGIDFACPTGTPIYAAADGIVIQGRDRARGSVDGFGSWIWIDAQASAGLDFIYGHVHHPGILVRSGDRVRAGQQIGVSGNEGNTTGPHLHFETWSPPGRQGGTAKDPAPWLAGATDPTAQPTPEAPAMSKPAFRDVLKLGYSRSPRHGARTIWFFLHTQEGNGTAESLANYLNNPANSASYHYTVDERTRVAVVDTDYASWSVLDANNRSINLCFAGSRAAQTRAQWLANYRNAIRIAAYTVVEDARKYSYLNPRVVQGRPYSRGNVPCISDHNFVSTVLRIGNHHDVGPNFPWDVFEADIRAYLSPTTTPPPPAVNRINEAAAAAPWLGARVKTGRENNIGEVVTPDKAGRFAKFEHGYVYWSPKTGAHAIPNRLFEVWAEHGWEAGPLGYPVAGRTELDGGLVQAFEGGVLYRQTGADTGYYVHGLIGARWAREGYEDGPLGYPVSNEYDHDGGGRRQDFEHGRMDYHPSGAVRTLDVQVEVNQ